MNNNKNAAAVGRALVAFGAALFAGLGVSGSVLGQQPAGLQVDVGECVKLESPGERLDCYERQVKRAQSAPAAPATAVTPPAAAPPAARDVRVEDARVANGASSDNSPALTGTIVALREIVPNRWLITLENGQMWRQTYAEAYPLRLGQRIEVARGGRRSSYQLAAIGVNGDIQVEPVR